MQKPGTEFPWQKTHNQTPGLVKDILEEGQRAGLFVLDDPDLAVLMLLGGLRGAWRSGRKPRSACLAGRIVEGFVAGRGRREEAVVSARRERRA